LATIHARENLRRNRAVSHEVISPQLIDCEPNKFFIYGRVDFFTKQPGNLGGGRPPIAPFPNKGSRLVQAMGAVAVEIID
jgi:hypothetical protein